MPELPEVEITRRRIAPLLIGRRIAAIETTGASYFFLSSPLEMEQRLPGLRFAGLRRVGKYLVAEFEDGAYLLLHLGMTGQLFAAGASSPRLLSSTARAALAPEQQTRFQPDRHTHLSITFEDAGAALYFRDVRKFGKCGFRARGVTDRRIERLGVDALEVRPTQLHASSRKRRIPIKTLLLDQAVLAGVGNIYADEALFRAGIRPTRPAQRLSRADCERLADALHLVLNRSIEAGGTTISDFVHPDGSDGGFQHERAVYGFEGRSCVRCGSVIRRIVLATRSSHFCPRCQR